MIRTIWEHALSGAVRLWSVVVHRYICMYLRNGAPYAAVLFVLAATAVSVVLLQRKAERHGITADTAEVFTYLEG